MNGIDKQTHVDLPTYLGGPRLSARVLGHGRSTRGLPPCVTQAYVTVVGSGKHYSELLENPNLT